MKKPSQSHRGV